MEIFNLMWRLIQNETFHRAFPADAFIRAIVFVGDWESEKRAIGTSQRYPGPREWNLQVGNNCITIVILFIPPYLAVAVIVIKMTETYFDSLSS